MPATSSPATRRRTAARLLLLAAVLLGLFLMHGAPTADAADCHSVTTAMPTPAQAPTPAPTAMAHPERPERPQAAPAAHPHPGGAPGSCLALPARAASAHAVAPALFTPVTRTFTPLHRAAHPLPHRRGPPTGGRDVLLQVCVARN
ncbi:hypothetical protein ACFYNO_19120 [Kitasatospora sp. NPDC006697]|uniref:hypothetical protein n=1 Tax=Kitasatospora sp. NPDC006697 TaxID=3364020 RepID=UPI00369CA36D